MHCIGMKLPFKLLRRSICSLFVTAGISGRGGESFTRKA